MSKVQLWKQRFFYGATDMAGNLIWQIVGLYLLFTTRQLWEFHPHLSGPCSSLFESLMPLMVCVWILDRPYPFKVWEGTAILLMVRFHWGF